MLISYIYTKVLDWYRSAMFRYYIYTKLLYQYRSAMLISYT